MHSRTNQSLLSPRTPNGSAYDSKQKQRGASYLTSRTLAGLVLLSLVVWALVAYTEIGKKYGSLGNEDLQLVEWRNLAAGSRLPKGLTFKCPPEAEYVAQRGEDRWLESYWMRQFFKVGGTFVEIGAFQGKKWSNSYWLEKCLGWTGLLVEGDPSNHKECVRTRGDCLHSAVCEQKEGGTVTFVSGGPTAGQPDAFPDAFAKKFHPDMEKKPHFQVPCRPFAAILADNDIKAIDVWSLDVENAEQIVLDTHDWNVNPVHLLIIEAPRQGEAAKKRAEFLESKCMKGMDLSKAFHSHIWYNEWYPLPACEGKRLYPDLVTVDAEALYTDVPFPEVR